MEDNQHSKIWNERKLQLYFEEQSISNIKAMEIRCEEEDQMIWKLEPKGKFTTKSLYSPLIRRDNTTNHQTKKMWQNIWSMKVAPRIKTFIWMCVQSILPLNERIGRKIQTVNKICPNGGKQEETLTHIFMHCEFAISVYNCLQIDTTLVHSDNLNFHMWFSTWNKSNNHEYDSYDDWPEILATVLWGIWKSRCDWVFQKKKLHTSRTVDLIITMINSNRNTKYNLDNTHGIVISSSRISNKPSMFTTRINIAMINSRNTNFVAVALINSDHTGAFLGGGTFSATAIEGEGIEEQAAYTTIQWLLQLNHPNGQIESDNGKVLEAISRQISCYRRDRIKLHGGNSKNFILCINSICTMSLIPNQENSLALMLAAKCLHLSCYCLWDCQALNSFLPTYETRAGDNILVM